MKRSQNTHTHTHIYIFISTRTRIILNGTPEKDDENSLRSTIIYERSHICVANSKYIVAKVVILKLSFRRDVLCLTAVRCTDVHCISYYLNKRALKNRTPVQIQNDFFPMNRSCTRGDENKTAQLWQDVKEKNKYSKKI